MKQIFLAALLLILAPTPLFAEMVESKDILEEAISHFRNYQGIQIEDATIPTVVEFPVDANSPADYLLMELGSNSVEPFALIRDQVETSYTVTTDHNAPSESAALTDGDPDTQAEYLVTDTTNTVQAILNYEHEITTSGFIMTLAPNATLPTTISIATANPQKIVVATKRFEGAYTHFPQTTAKEWVVTLTYTQPLVVSEMSFLENSSTIKRVSLIRFLARPDSSYVLYSNPTGEFRIPRTLEAGNLHGNALPVERFAAPPLELNPEYQEPDSDADGIRDETDNCSTFANPNQEDKNDNGVGDACEDFDTDGILNALDNCPDHINALQQDADGDGIGDHCDEGESRLTEQLSFLPWVGIGIGFIIVIGIFVKTAKSHPKRNISNPKKDLTEKEPQTESHTK